MLWISFFNWFLGILSVSIWVGTFIFWERRKFIAWLDNKFGKDDPMPPTPKQQNNPLNIGENSTINFSKSLDSEQKKE